jgi:sugar phosphate isomerase/epimerase
MPAPATVLGEMAELGLHGTELGPPGFLPDAPAALAGLLERHGLALVGGFVPPNLVLHEPALDALAVELRAGRRSLLSATRDGLFKALGKGDARIAEVMDALRAHGYGGSLVLEQDTAITAEEPTVAGGPMRDARESIAFLYQSARMTEEINR